MQCRLAWLWAGNLVVLAGDKKIQNPPSSTARMFMSMSYVFSFPPLPLPRRCHLGRYLPTSTANIHQYHSRYLPCQASRAQPLSLPTQPCKSNSAPPPSPPTFLKKSTLPKSTEPSLPTGLKSVLKQYWDLKMIL